MKPPRSRSWLVRFGAGAFTLLPSLLGRAGSTIVVILVIVLGVSVATGIASDFVAAIRAELQQWRSTAERDAFTADQEKRRTELAVSTTVTERPPETGQPLSLGELLQGFRTELAPVLDSKKLTQFLEGAAAIFTKVTGDDFQLSRDELVNFLIVDDHPDRNALIALFDSVGLDINSDRRQILNRAMDLKRWEINLSTREELNSRNAGQ